jgi:hypothetical protein
MPGGGRRDVSLVTSSMIMFALKGIDERTYM